MLLAVVVVVVVVVEEEEEEEDVKVEVEVEAEAEAEEAPTSVQCTCCMAIGRSRNVDAISSKTGSTNEPSHPRCGQSSCGTLLPHLSTQYGQCNLASSTGARFP